MPSAMATKTPFRCGKTRRHSARPKVIIRRENISNFHFSPHTGFLIHFGFVCSLTWWLCSIFNIFISLRCKTRPNPVRHHPKFLFVVEAVLSMGLPLVVTAIVLSTDAGYGTYSVEIITCGPASDNLMYFTFALPLQIITYIGSAMVIYILKETRQVLM